MRATLGAVLGALSLVLLVLLPTAPASAHADLVSSTPEDGAALATSPQTVVLTFSEELLPDTVVLSVEDETGFVVRVLSFTVEGSDVIVTWPPGIPGRVVGLNYRVVSQDGHPISGTVRYTLEQSAAPSGSASPAAPTVAPTVTPTVAPTTVAEPPADSPSMAPVAAIAAGLGVGIAIGAVVVLRRRRTT